MFPADPVLRDDLPDPPPAVAAAWILATLAAALGPLLLVGLPGSFASSGQDTGAAMLWLHGMAEAMARGEWWPRWLAEGNRGFGSPAFLFYPPFAYWVGAAVQAATGADDAQALVESALLFRLATALLAYAWLRRQAGRGAALAATALLLLQSYNLLVNPLVRFAFAEMAGTAVLLLALCAADARRPLRWVPPAFALLTLTHLPMAVLAGGVLPGWGLVVGGARRAGLVLLGCLAGAALAGAYLVPALLLLPEIHAAGWETGGLTTWSGHFLLEPAQPPKPPVQFWLINSGLLAMLGGLAALICYGRRRVPPLHTRCAAAAALLLAMLCLLMTRLSWPVWALLPLLQRVQFPWRLLPFAAAVWAMLFAWRLDALARVGLRGGQRIAAGVALASGALALWIPYSAVTAAMPALARYDWTRLAFPPPGPRPLPAVNPPEYAPAAAARAGWQADRPETDVLLRQRLARNPPAGDALRIEAAPEGGFRIAGRLTEPSSLVLPQFGFPGWRLDGRPAAQLSTDAATGLLRLELPAGPVDLDLHRTVTGAERMGWRISAAALPLCLLLGWLPARRLHSHAPAKGQHDPEGPSPGDRRDHRRRPAVACRPVPGRLPPHGSG